MPVFSLHIKTRSCLTAICVGLSLLAGYSGLAQDSIGKGTDTVSVTVTAAGGDSPGINQGVDTESSKVTAPPVMRSIPDSLIDSYKKEKDFAYANDPAFWLKDKNKNEANKDNRFLYFLQNLLSGKGFQYFMYILLGGILVYALIRIMSENNLRLFDRSSRKMQTGTEGATELPEEDLEERLRQAVQAGNYRLGVRYLFLKSLRALNDHGMINYHMQATNQDYINQLSGRTQAASFKFLADAYDHVWYGGFLLNEEQYGRLSGYFQDFFRSIAEK